MASERAMRGCRGCEWSDPEQNRMRLCAECGIEYTRWEEPHDKRIAAERARAEKLAAALAVAREAMEERREYAELQTWVKSKYGGEWDMEDRLVEGSLAEYRKGGA